MKRKLIGSVVYHKSTPIPSPPAETQPTRPQMYPWQQEVYTALKQGKNIFVVAPAGAGKTYPIIQYWLDSFTSTNDCAFIHQNLVDPESRNKYKVPKCVWMVPRRMLAYDKYEELVDGPYNIPTLTGCTNIPKETGVAVVTGGERLGNPITSAYLVGIYESIANIAHQFVDRNILFVIDEAHMAMYEIDKDRTAQIGRALSKIFTRFKHAQYAFLTGTVHHTMVANFIDFMRHEYGIEIEGHLHQHETRTVLRVTIDNHLHNTDYVVHLIASLVRARKPGNVFVYFSVDTIRQIARKVIDILHRHMQPDSDPELTQVKDPGVRQMLSYGMATVYRVMEEDDKRIVLRRFNAGKAYVLLATDAIGIGVDAKILTMYIPSIRKPTGPLKEVELIQILKRAGRTGHGIIVVPLDLYDTITRALAADPTVAVEMDTATMKKYMSKPSILSRLWELLIHGKGPK